MFTPAAITGGRRTLVTGGAGFIGIHLVDELLRSGRDVLIVGRSVPRRPDHVIFFAKADVLDLERLEILFKQFAPTEVVHLAAKTDFVNWEDADGFQTNTQGTHNVLRVVATTPSVGRCLFASSHVVGLPRVADRASRHGRQLYLYEESKLKAEQIIRADATSDRARCIVRPCSGWGPWFRQPFYEFFLAIARGRYFHPGRSEARKRLAYVGNICFQLVKLLDAPADQIHRRTFYLTDYETTTLRTWANLIADRLGVHRPVTLPEALVGVGAFVGDLLKIIGYRNVPLSSSRLVNMKTDTSDIPIDEIQSIAGPLPFTMEDGVSRPIDWLRQEGLVT